MRTPHTAAAVALTALMAMGLTACKDDGASDASSQASASAATATSSVTAAPADASAAADTSKGTGNGTPASQTPTAKDGQGSAPSDCTTDNLKFTAENVSRPINHMLITATNTTSEPCYIYGFPSVTFSDQGPIGTAEETKPKYVVTVPPKESVYAGVTLSTGTGSGKASGHDASSIGLTLHAAEGSGTTGSAVTVAAPGGSVYVEEGTAEVTYWQESADDALNW
ncbi:DUF4232 domain-containing protein [Streptomyces sp. NPDC002577]